MNRVLTPIAIALLFIGYPPFHRLRSPKVVLVLKRLIYRVHHFRNVHFVKTLPNIGRPLFDCSRERFLLDHIPVLDKNAVLDAENVRCNPVHGQAEICKTSVHYYELSISDDRSRLILERRRKALDEIEQTLTTRRDMSAMLNVVRRPVAFGRYVVPFVEECVKSLKDECLVLFLSSSAHSIPPIDK